ncbi:hypothetical protein BJ742DRAFT_747017 [Cladochytrium replicatum]|nr:hypothetical protein BJ742DRAFT_747017 [Cladochytrium replicatum]
MCDPQTVVQCGSPERPQPEKVRDNPIHVEPNHGSHHKEACQGRLDKYYHMAKEQGYRARSAFKLIQLNRKFNFLERSRCLIELCTAPGVAAKYMPRQSIIVGLDLNPIKPIPGVITLVEDITTAKCRSSLKKELKTRKADVVLHDGAPNVGTSWLQDAFTQNELVLSSLKLATEFHVFRSKDYNKLIWVLHQLFKKVEATKPQSSRNVSAEIFVVCREYLAPKKIDEKLLDAKWVFKEMDDNKRRRHRDGYEDGDCTLHKSRSITDFIKGSDFVSVLAKSNELRFDQDEDGKGYANHPLTTDEIKQCCKDLRVLGKRDFKDLLKWRQEIRISLGVEEKNQEKVTRKLEEAKKEEEGDLAELFRFAAAESNELLARARRLERKSKDRKAKHLMKLRFGMETPMDIGIEASASMGFEEDQSYEEYKERQIQKDKKLMARKEKKMKKAKAEEGGELVRDGSYDDFSDSRSDGDVDEIQSTKRKRASESKYIDDEDDDDAEVPTLSKKAKIFFQIRCLSMFDVEMNDLDSNSESENENVKSKSKKKQNGLQSKKVKSDDTVTGKPPSGGAESNESDNEDHDDFAIATAETYTMAQNLLTVKGKRDLIDGSFNRSAYNDPDGLPEWFMDDENRHKMPVTKEAIEIMRAKMQELNARPIKNVMEAKFRKKLRTMKKLRNFRRRHRGLKARPKVNVVVAKGSNRGISGRPKGVKGKYKMVDPRMKKEV